MEERKWAVVMNYKGKALLEVFLIIFGFFFKNFFSEKYTHFPNFA